jgi:hypothetical protein
MYKQIMLVLSKRKQRSTICRWQGPVDSSTAVLPNIRTLKSGTPPYLYHNTDGILGHPTARRSSLLRRPPRAGHTINVVMNRKQ